MWSVWVIHTNYQASPQPEPDFFSRGWVNLQKFFFGFFSVFLWRSRSPMHPLPRATGRAPVLWFRFCTNSNHSAGAPRNFSKEKKRMLQAWTSSFEPVQPAQTSNKTQYTNAPQPLINKGIKKKRFKMLKFC